MNACTVFAEQRVGLVAEIRRLLQPRPGRLEFASRLALVCALTTLVVEIYQTPDPALTVYIAFFLNKPDRTESIILNVVFTLVITVTIAIIIGLAMLVLDDALWRVAAMSTFSVGFLFIAFASKLRPLAGTITLIVGYALDVLGTVHSGEIATRAALYAWLFVAIPAGVSLVVNLLLGPPPRKLAERAIAHRLQAAAAVLRAPGPATRTAFIECVREGFGEIQAWLKLAGVEKTSPTQDIAALSQAAQSSAGILSWVDVVTRPGGGAIIPALLLQRLAQTLEEMAAVLSKGGYPIEIALPPEEEAARLAPGSAELWTDINDLLAQFAAPPLAASVLHTPPASMATPTAASVQSAAPAQATAQRPAKGEQPPPAGFFLPDAFTNPEYVQYALKTTAAAMFCYVLYSLLDWPAIHTCFITCYIIALGTSAETVEKLTLRIAGCIVGGAAGLVAIVYLLPYMTSVQALLAVVFLGALPSAWVAVGSPRISYAGFQMAFAFFLCVIQGSSPAFDLTIARDRVIGILLGNVVVYLLFTRVWPVSVAKRIDPAIAAAMRLLSAMTLATDPSKRRSLAAQAQGGLGSLEQDLHLVRYEPATIRPAESWLRARDQAAHEVGALQGPLLFGTGREPAYDSSIAQRLQNVAGDFQAGNAPGVPRHSMSDAQPEPTEVTVRGDLQRVPSQAAPQGALGQMISDHLESLEGLWSLGARASSAPTIDRQPSHAAV